LSIADACEAEEQRKISYSETFHEQQLQCSLEEEIRTVRATKNMTEVLSNDTGEI